MNRKVKSFEQTASWVVPRLTQTNPA